MKLVFIYGPPAAGKLTVATELGRLTSYAVWDNHLSIDGLLPVFPFGSPSLNRLAEQIRVAVLDEAARTDIDVIFTFVFAHPEDIGYVERLLSAVEAHGGSVCLVQLTCTAEEQERRVVSADRARRQKTRSVERVREWNEQMDLLTPVPGRPSLTIDTMVTPADESARQIAEHYGLPVNRID